MGHLILPSVRLHHSTTQHKTEHTGVHTVPFSYKTSGTSIPPYDYHYDEMMKRQYGTPTLGQHSPISDQTGNCPGTAQQACNSTASTNSKKVPGCDTWY